MPRWLRGGLAGQGTWGRSPQEVRKVAVWGSPWGAFQAPAHAVGLSSQAAVVGVGELRDMEPPGVSPPKVHITWGRDVSGSEKARGLSH